MIVIIILIFTFWLHHVACGILVPQPGIELAPSAVEVLTTGLPGKSQVCLFVCFPLTFIGV